MNPAARPAARADRNSPRSSCSAMSGWSRLIRRMIPAWLLESGETTGVCPACSFPFLPAGLGLTIPGAGAWPAGVIRSAMAASAWELSIGPLCPCAWSTRTSCTRSRRSASGQPAPHAVTGDSQAISDAHLRDAGTVPATGTIGRRFGSPDDGADHDGQHRCQKTEDGVHC